MLQNRLKKIYALLKAQKFIYDSYSRLIEIPRCQDPNKVYESYRIFAEESKTLDIGCGQTPRNPFSATTVFGLDIFQDDSKNIKFADLFIEPIPYPEHTFNFLTAFDFIEHVPRVVYSPTLRFSFVELMNEVHRVLVPDGIFLSHTPIFPFPASFQDPTHVNMITEDTFPKYFDDTKIFASIYGFKGKFKVEQQVLSPPYLISILRKKSAN